MEFINDINNNRAEYHLIKVVQSSEVDYSRVRCTREATLIHRFREEENHHNIPPTSVTYGQHVRKRLTVLLFIHHYIITTCSTLNELE